MFLTAQGGFLGPFAWVFGKLFNFIYNLLANDSGIANLGLCIIIFTVICRLLIFPLTFKQQRSAKINMVLQPEISKIQKKYKDKKDQESMMKQQREIQAVYDKYGTSMTNGCFTMLIQFPFMYVLYRVIQNVPAYVDKVKVLYEPLAEGILKVKSSGIEISKFFTEFTGDNKITSADYALRQLTNLVSDGMEIGINNIIDVISKFDIKNLHLLSDTLGIQVNTSIDNIEKAHSFIFGINISQVPGYNLSWALLIPLTAGLFQFLSMKIIAVNQPQADGSAGNMMKSMQIMGPLMTVFMCISLPAYLSIYWATSSLIAVITQLFVNLYYDHVDMDAILEKQMELAAKKLEKRGGKKSFMQRMMDEAENQQEQIAKQQAIHNNSASSIGCGKAGI